MAWNQIVFLFARIPGSSKGKQSGKMLSTTFFQCNNCVCVAQTSFPLRILFMDMDSRCKAPRGIICWRLRKHVFKPPACLLQHLGTGSNLLLHWPLGLVSLPSKHSQRGCFEHWELFWRALFPYLVLLLLWAQTHFIEVDVTLEKEMATHSSVLAWRIPGTGEPGGLPSMGSHRVRHNWSDLAAADVTSIHLFLSYSY